MEDENGNIVRETMKDTDTLARYKTMHETLVYLSHFDHEDTENQMLSKLHLQVCHSSDQQTALYNCKAGHKRKPACALSSAQKLVGAPSAAGIHVISEGKERTCHGPQGMTNATSGGVVDLASLAAQS